MGPVLVALFDDYGVANRVRSELVASGFPTDRVELTSKRDSLQAGAEPGDSFREKTANYFQTLFDKPETASYAELFSKRVQQGDSAITVHPRFDHEVATAHEILQRHRPVELGEHGPRIIEGQGGPTQASRA